MKTIHAASRLRVQHTRLTHRRGAGAHEVKVALTRPADRIITRAVEMVRAALDRREDLGAERERLAALDRRIRNTLTLAQDAADDHELSALRDELAQMRGERQKLRDRITAAEYAGEANVDALRERLGVMLENISGTLAGDVATARAALRAVIAEDADGQRRLDVIADTAEPDGFRIEGTLRIPVALGERTPSTKDGDPGVSRTLAEFPIALPFAA